MAELTYGQRIVGAQFNPSNNEKVDALKKLFAEAIDIVASVNLEDSIDSVQIMLVKHATTEALNAQMAAVKAVTWGKS